MSSPDGPARDEVAVRKLETGSLPAPISLVLIDDNRLLR